MICLPEGSRVITTPDPSTGLVAITATNFPIAFAHMTLPPIEVEAVSDDKEFISSRSKFIAADHLHFIDVPGVVQERTALTGDWNVTGHGIDLPDRNISDSQNPCKNHTFTLCDEERAVQPRVFAQTQINSHTQKLQSFCEAMTAF